MMSATITPRRSSLSPTLAEILVCLRKNKIVVQDYLKFKNKQLSSIQVSEEDIVALKRRISDLEFLAEEAVEEAAEE